MSIDIPFKIFLFPRVSCSDINFIGVYIIIEREDWIDHKDEKNIVKAINNKSQKITGDRLKIIFVDGSKLEKISVSIKI